MDKYREVKEKICALLRDTMDFSREVTDEEVQQRIHMLLLEEKELCCFSMEKRKRLAKEIFSAIRRLDLLQELVDDEAVTEIMINGTESIFVERAGRLMEWTERFDQKRLADVIQQIVADCNRVVNEAAPIVDARLQNGSRVNIVMNPVALNGPAVTIRRFPDCPVQMEDLLKWGSITKEAAFFLKQLVRARYNIFISGGTGSGKTTFRNVLSEYIPAEERVITIEDSAELVIQNIPNLVQLETRNSNVDGCEPITIRDLIRTALRMRPDRVIVGEVRGSEALDMLQAMNTGHDGSLSTGHGNTAQDMLTRLETMVLMGMELPLRAIRKQIASGIDILIHLGRLRDKSRKVLQIVEVLGCPEEEILTRVLYEYEEEGEDPNGRVIGGLRKKEELLHVEKLGTAGIRL